MSKSDQPAGVAVDRGVRPLRERLQACIDDPMWSDHAEVPKALLQKAVQALEETADLAGHYMAQRDEARQALPRHPTLAECEAAGRGPENYPGKPFEVGGLPATKEERARFEAYMRGHCWDVGHYVDAEKCYDTTFVRCLFGVWRDRGALPTVWPNTEAKGPRSGPA